MSRPGVDLPRVLLLWPGGLFSGDANFGVPQLLSIAGALEQDGCAVVDVVDLDMERGFGRVDLARIAAPHYDVVGISCYSSYDLLKVMAIGARLRACLPNAWLVTGGYHPSARPNDFTTDDSPFDYVIIGDGEAPMRRLLASYMVGKRPTEATIGPEPWSDPNELPPYDWSKLARYQPIARKLASQAEIYLSRGCPFDCAFCMERAKRDTSWRALEPERAVDEIHRLDSFLDLSEWTLFITDALFGMKRSWRRSFLEQLIRRPCRARKLWLLIRVDLIEREDLELMARANVACGFGLESGDPEQLKRIHKAGAATGFLEHMNDVASWARELDLPFGANVIVGHPGETERSMRSSAAYLERLFLGDSRGTTGFLSVDPFRLYPGSPIDAELSDWKRETGMRTHRYPWWNDGDQDFLAEWIDPSAELDFRATLQLRRELFDPILLQIPERFVYSGPAADYFRRAVDEQVALCKPKRYLHTIGMWHLWRALCGESETDPQPPSGDLELAEVARLARLATMKQEALGKTPAIARALEVVPRECFVDSEQIGASAADIALSLSADNVSTLSAMHAYEAAFTALGLIAGDHFVELGGSTGYGAALAATVVGPTGTVRSLEIDLQLAAQATRNLAPYPNAEIVAADAHDTQHLAGAEKVYVAFALAELPKSWLDALAPRAQLVAPIGNEEQQMLTLFEKRNDGTAERTELQPVRYVPDRTPL